MQRSSLRPYNPYDTAAISEVTLLTIALISMVLDSNHLPRPISAGKVQNTVSWMLPLYSSNWNKGGLACHLWYICKWFYLMWPLETLLNVYSAKLPHQSKPFYERPLIHPSIKYDLGYLPKERCCLLLCVRSPSCPRSLRGTLYTKVVSPLRRMFCVHLFRDWEHLVLTQALTLNHFGLNPNLGSQELTPFVFCPECFWM